MAGPDHRDGEVTATDSETTRPVPRKSAPISALRRKKKPSAPSRTPEPAQPSEPARSKAATAQPVSTERTEAAPVRSGAGMSYRERRRAGGSGETSPRVVAKKADRSGLGVALAGVVAGLVVVALIVTSVLFATATSRIDDRDAQRAEYSSFARQMIVNLTSLSPDTVDQLTDTYQTKTTGKALEQLQQSMQQTVDNIKAARVTTRGTILSDAVVNSDSDSATVIVVSGWTMNNPEPAAGAPAAPADQGPVVQTFRWKVDITKINGEMKMDNIGWVT